jgi:ribosomal protein L37AE/L43A
MMASELVFFRSWRLARLPGRFSPRIGGQLFREPERVEHEQYKPQDCPGHRGPRARSPPMIEPDADQDRYCEFQGEGRDPRGPSDAHREPRSRVSLIIHARLPHPSTLSAASTQAREATPNRPLWLSAQTRSTGRALEGKRCLEGISLTGLAPHVNCPPSQFEKFFTMSRISTRLWTASGCRRIPNPPIGASVGPQSSRLAADCPFS